MKTSKKPPITKKKVVGTLDRKAGTPTYYSEWMDQDDVGEDLKNWTPTGIIGPQAAMFAELTGEDRPEMTQAEEEYFEDQEFGMRTDA